MLADSKSRFSLVIVSAVLMVGTASAPVFADPTVSVQARHVILQTSDIDVDSIGASEGSLRISIAQDGTIQGYYRAAESALLTDVHGSLKGTKMTLFIGSSPAPIVGVFDNQKLEATVLEHNREHRFTAVISDIERS